jgi:hypothetical protein
MQQNVKLTTLLLLASCIINKTIITLKFYESFLQFEGTEEGVKVFQLETGLAKAEQKIHNIIYFVDYDDEESDDGVNISNYIYKQRSLKFCPSYKCDNAMVIITVPETKKLDKMYNDDFNILLSYVFKLMGYYPITDYSGSHRYFLPRDYNESTLRHNFNLLQRLRIKRSNHIALVIKDGRNKKAK